MRIHGALRVVKTTTQLLNLIGRRHTFIKTLVVNLLVLLKRILYDYVELKNVKILLNFWKNVYYGYSFSLFVSKWYFVSNKIMI